MSILSIRVPSTPQLLLNLPLPFWDQFMIAKDSLLISALQRRDVVKGGGSVKHVCHTLCENLWHARNQSDKQMPHHRIMVRTAGQNDSQEVTKLADCLLIWQIRRKCSISISEWLFFWLPHLAEIVLRAPQGGGNSLSFALFPPWELDDLCLNFSQHTLSMILDNNLL